MPDSAPSLGELIDMQIRANGPMSIATYMELCLTHPRQGYYRRADPLGAAGDFITAPEISQMFGELIGLFIVNLWQQMGEPRSFTLLELGPGRGTLMDDLLRAATRADGFANALHLQLFDTSDALREQQAKLLGPYNPYWSTEIDTVSDDPLIVIANEFFDALPVRQFVRTDKGWHERLIGLKEGKRSFGLAPVPIPETAVPAVLRDAAPGTVYEACPPAADAMLRLSRKVAAQGGAILTTDYGYAAIQAGETLQAVSRHAFADPLAAPGEIDLSAHVNFGALAQAATAGGLIAHPLTSQGNFLRRLGIVERADVLEKANPAEADNITAALSRLTGAEAMGELFKVFCATGPKIVPPGIGP